MLLQNSWYPDNGILAGTEVELMQSFDFLESEGKVGLQREDLEMYVVVTPNHKQVKSKI